MVAHSVAAPLGSKHLEWAIESGADNAAYAIMMHFDVLEAVAFLTKERAA